MSLDFRIHDPKSATGAAAARRSVMSDRMSFEVGTDEKSSLVSVKLTRGEAAAPAVAAVFGWLSTATFPDRTAVAEVRSPALRRLMTLRWTPRLVMIVDDRKREEDLITVERVFRYTGRACLCMGYI